MSTAAVPIDEVERQAAVLTACRAMLPAGMPLESHLPSLGAVTAARLRTDTAGILAYQLNAQATARRVLSSTFPTVRAMLGEQALDALAISLWQSHPPETGDLGDWGHALPELLALHPELQNWPWLPDCARLDWAVHQCERAADAELDADSLQLLSHAPPESLTLQLKPHVRALTSPWPIAALLEAHQLPSTEQAAASFVALSQGMSGAVVVSRHPWRAQAHSVTDAVYGWMQALMADDAAEAGHMPKPVSQLLDAAGADFDFSAWLTMALKEGWLWRVRQLTDRSDGS